LATHQSAKPKTKTKKLHSHLRASQCDGGRLPSAARGNMLVMRVCRVCADLIVTFLVLVADVALLPIRLCAALVGGVLALAGVVGLPVWLVQLVISAAGGGDGGGPLSPWGMCGLLAAAIPVGLALLQIANLGLGGESTAGVDLDRPEVTAMNGSDPVGVATERFAAPTGASTATVALAPARIGRALGCRARHELRLRALSRHVAAGKRRRRGAH
jgi:hypothetical protein